MQFLYSIMKATSPFLQKAEGVINADRTGQVFLRAILRRPKRIHSMLIRQTLTII